MRGFKNKKAVAWIVMLVFLFTCVMPSGTALAAANDQQIEAKGGSSSNSDVTISKTIAGTDKENYFDITLTVKTSKTIEELALTQKTDVVIVMDISNTMNTNDRIGNAKTAAKQFVKDFTDAMGSSGRVGLVTFNRDAKNIQGFTSNATTLNNKIDAITAPSDTDIKWTNIEGGLRLASNMLSSSTAPHKYIILLTDGFPTTYIKSGASATTTITGYYPSSSSGKVGADGVFRNQELNKWCSAGTDYSDKGATKAQTVANSIKNSGINIFSVGIDIGGQTIQGYLDKHNGQTFSTVDTDSKKDSYVIGSATDANAYKNWLGNKIAGGPDLSATNAVRYSDGNNLNALKNAYSKIFEEIKTINTKAIENEWIAADPMGEDVEFQYFYDKNGKAAKGNLTGSHAKNAENTATYSKDKISWTLLKSGYTTTKDGKTTYYQYNLKYRVRLENEKSGFTEKTDKVTNGTTTLKYKVNDNGKLSGEKSLEFKVPEVEGYLANLEFTKTDACTGEGLAGAKFTLTHNANCSVCDDVTIAAQTKTSGADGKVTFTNIPSGHEYTLTETTAPNGYEKVTKSYTVKVAYDVLTITNKDNTFTGTAFINNSTDTSVKVEKVWADSNNQDGTRPTAIQVQLKADNTAYGNPVELNKANNWKYEWKGLEAYKNGKEVSYTVEEVKVPDGYTAKVTGNVANGFKITNSYTPETIDISGEKTWNDNDNQDGKRPSEITVNLLADGDEVAEVKVTGPNWTYEFTDLDKYADGKEIAYTVTEDAVDGYTTAVNGYDIVNSYTPETIDISGEKTWNDNNNQDGKRPSEITVRLLADGKEVREVKVSADANGNWNYSFTNLDKYANGKEIKYTVTEDAVDDYTAKVTGYDIVNSYTPERTSVSGSKIWIDDSSVKRPAEIIVKLLANDVEVDRVVVDGDRSDRVWTYEFTDLPKYENGKVIDYTVEEIPVANYTTAINGYNITNTIEQKYFDISGTKTWAAPEGTVYPEIVIDLFRDGKPYDEVTLAPGTVTYAFENLEAYDLTDGHMYQYQLAERKVDGYVPSYEMTVNGEDRIIDITNTYSDEDEEFVTISGEKNWVAPAGTVLPASVTIHLYQNGTQIDSMEVTEAMNWQYSFDGLPMYDADGVAYSYTVKEVPVDGYLSLVVPTAKGFDITNTLYVGEAGQFSVSKVVSGGSEMVPNDSTEYSFILKVKATVNDWDSMKVYQKSELEDARDDALAELDAANEELAGAERLFRQNAVAFTTGSAYEFIMVEEVYYDEPEVTTGSAYDYTTGSAYKYTIVDNAGDILVKRSTTSSALFMNFTPAADAQDAITRVIEAIKALADEFKNLNKASVFLNMLHENQQSSTPSALKFNRTDAEELLQAERDVQDAKALVEAREQAIDDFMKADVTTPSAIKITMTPTAGSGLAPVVMELDTDSALYDADSMTYAINFDLLKDSGYVFTIEAADKAEIEYSISEINWEFDNYVGTEITVNGTDKLDGRYVAPRAMDKASADSYVFNNIYEDNPPPPPPTEPDDPPYVPPTEPDEPDDPPYVPPYEPPVIPDEPDVPEEPVVIEEPEVPLVDIPGEIIEEEDIPMGDAPPTGDNTNAVPFMMMMAAATVGMMMIRRRFN